MSSYSIDIDSIDLCQLKDVWVFGYGSILWNPGFSFSSKHCGYVDGYLRRFWQGSTTHRGTSQMPGRVATLIQHEGARAWGMAFHVIGSANVQACLHHLGLRECYLGGYEVRHVLFKASDQQTTDSSADCASEQCINAWAFVAIPGNKHFLGPATIDDLALQVTTTAGSSGPNFEYVTKLAEFVRHHIPQDTDQHLFELDRKIRQLLASTSVMATTSRDLKVNVSDSINGNDCGESIDNDVIVQQEKNVTDNNNNNNNKNNTGLLLNFVTIANQNVISIRAC